MKTPPPLKNDCFALPPGVEWTPVDQVHDILNDRLRAVVGVENVALGAATGRILAKPVVARQSHPPTANSAVDGYALAGEFGTGEHCVPLVSGRSAAGHGWDAVLTPNAGLRILTGAPLPEGTDTVILQEDVVIDGDQLIFNGPLKPWSNCRHAGEDLRAGDIALPAHRHLRPQDLALAAAVGCHEVTCFRPLKVGILSSGDELRDPGETQSPGTNDANRPMLLSLVSEWGFDAIDGGIAPDDRKAVQQILKDLAGRCDVILTSGGASAGDEDHIAATLETAGDMAVWRIAIKPGRPMAMGIFEGVPVFGLPGNPVAAFVCALLFARPSLAKMAGGVFEHPFGFHVPATFSKRKKAGRREYLRAHLNPDGSVDKFSSEGSGRISGLSWANGLIELPDEALEIEPGDLVRFLPFGSFGI